MESNSILIEGTVFPGKYNGSLSFIMALRQHGIARVRINDDDVQSAIKHAIEKNCATVSEAMAKQNLPGVSNPEDYERISIPGGKDRFAYELFAPKKMNPKEAFNVVKDISKSKDDRSWAIFKQCHAE